MIVISKINTKRIIKGQRYECVKQIRDRIFLKAFGWYSMKNFTNIDGKEIKEGSLSATVQTTVVRNRLTKFSDIKKGDVLVCMNTRYKTFTKGKMYMVEELETQEREFNGYSNSTYYPTRVYHVYYVKFVGFKRKIIFNGFNFRALNTQELRELKLSEVFSSESRVVKDSKIRGIELIDNPEKALLEILAQSIIDKNRHHLSVIDWACSKIGDKLSVKKSDFEPYLKMSLEEILSKID